MNNSKQAVLSIVGIAILVIAVVGVSFAFFTYSRTGTENNLITTGKITFNSNVAAYDSTSAASPLVLTNRFPQTDADGKTNVDGTTGKAYTFTVTGQIPVTANPVYYGVFVEETVMDGKTGDETHRFPYNQISVYVTDNGDQNANTNVARRFTTGGNYKLTSNVVETNAHTGELIAYGTVTNNGVEQTHTYTLTMWINDSVTISDTDYTKTYRASATDVGDSPSNLPQGTNADDRKVYTEMWYAVKVNVHAVDSSSTTYSSLQSAATDPTTP